MSLPYTDAEIAERRGWPSIADSRWLATVDSLRTRLAAAEADRGLSFAALRAVNVPRVAAFGQTLDAWSPMEWACAAAGEMGELCNALKKRSRKEDPKRPGHDITGKPIPTLRDVGDEIADVVIYLDLLGAALGIDMGEAVIRKWNEVSAKMGHAPRLTPAPATGRDACCDAPAINPVDRRCICGQEVRHG